MVFYFNSTVVEPPVTLFMGLDKYENEDLIQWGWPEDVWFHVDKVCLRGQPKKKIGQKGDVSHFPEPTPTPKRSTITINRWTLGIFLLAGNQLYDIFIYKE